jgi:CRP-like cAMP-binding protein
MIETLSEQIPALRNYSEQLKTNTLTSSQERILMNISGTSEEKYQEFVDSYPEVFNRVPLHMVASYLGVSRETLSRIRHAQLKQLRN